MINLATFLKPKRQLNLLIAAMFMALQMPLFLLAPQVASAAPGDKVFVCKYVGIPGVNERYQTGDNPISVNTNSIPNYQGPGSYFSDDQGRSFVLMVDDTAPGPSGDPNVSACPAPSPDVIQVPTVPVVDPCGLANAVFGTVPAGNYSSVLNPNGSITLTANQGFIFAGALAQVTLPAPTDSGVLCDTVIQVPTIPVVDPCGLANAVFGTVPAGNYSSVLNPNGSITLTANQGFVFAGSLTEVTLPAPTDSGVLCEEDGDKVMICHATSAIVNPYNKINVSVKAADGISGNSGNSADHYGQHKGSIFDPAVNDNGDDWGDIIPPIFGAHDGLNWTTLGQTIYNNPDCEVPAAPTAVAVIVPCVPDSGASDVVTVEVTNTDDDSDDSVQYSVQLGGQTKMITLADGDSGSVAFSGLTAGNYSAVVTGEDGTEATSNSVTVNICESGDILGETVTPTGGQGAATPALANTGRSIAGALFAALAIIGLTGALAITSRRARFNQ